MRKIFESHASNISPVSDNGLSGGDSVDKQLASLVEDYLRTSRLQISLKERINQLLKTREAEVKKTKNEPSEVFRKAEEKRQAMVRTSMSKKQRRKKTKVMDDNEQGMKAKVQSTDPPSGIVSDSPPLFDDSDIEKDVLFREMEMDRIQKKRNEEEIQLMAERFLREQEFDVLWATEMSENEDTACQARQEEEDAYWRCESAYWSYVCTLVFRGRSVHLPPE
jgi:hypothetical protein